MIHLDGVAPSSELRQQLVDEDKPVILNFSRGKDSIAAWVAMLESGMKPHNIVPIHLSSIPNLRFVKESLAHYEKVFDTKIVDLPSYGIWNNLGRYMYQPPTRASLLAHTEFARYPRLEWDALIREEYGQEDTWIVDGVRSADSPQRRMNFMRAGTARKDSQRRMSIVWDWQIAEVRAAMQRYGIDPHHPSPEYHWLGRSFDAIRHDTILGPKKLHKNDGQPEGMYRDYPDDVETIMQWFPFLRLDFMRAEMMNNA